MAYNFPSHLQHLLSPSPKANVQWMLSSKKLRGTDSSLIVTLSANSEAREQALREARYARSGAQNQPILEVD